jgi:hypothetical protein
LEVNEYIDEFCQLPSITGKDVVDLEKYAKLPRVQTYDSIKGFLEVARKAKEVRALFVVAEWGEGKTSIYEGLLRNPEVIKSDLVIPISTKRLITHIKEKVGTFYDTGSIGIRFFACLLYTIKDIIDNDLMDTPPFDRIKIRPKEEGTATILFIKNGLTSIFNTVPEESRVFLFIDEFEDIIDEPPDIRSFVIGGLVKVIDGYPRLLCKEGPFAGRLHLLIAVTPPAYEKLKAETFADWQRFFGQRASELRLEKLDRKSARDYILGVLKYCWHGALPKILFSEPGMFNTIYTATLGNPRSIVNLVEALLGHAKSQAPPGKVKVINPEDFIYVLSDKKITVYGGEVTLLDRTSLSALYGRLERKCKEMKLEVDKCIDILHLFLSNLSPISIERIGEKAGFEKKDIIWDYLRILSESFSELWGIDKPFIFFKRVVGKAEDVHSKLTARGAPQNLLKVVDALEFYEFDHSCLSFQNVLFVPYKLLGELSFEDQTLFQNYVDFFTNFSPELGSEDITVLVDRYVFDKVEKSDEEYVMLSPAIINIFYPSPSIFFLDFIEDLNKRFEIGTKLMRSLTEFEKEFHDGIIDLLQECENTEVERRFEPYGYGKEAEVITLRYIEATQQHSLRACILPLLKTSEEYLRSKVDAAIKAMREAHIPLLMIFSWNPLPKEIKSVLETMLSPGTKENFGKVFYYLEFPLTFVQCQQVCGYAVAKERGYRVREERWKARASRILDEIRFERRLGEFIRKGLTAGYTIRPLALKRLSLTNVPRLLRTFLVTDGTIEERFKMLQEMEKDFRVYGEDFPICPLDIESESSFRMFIDELEENGLIEVKEGSLKTDPTPIERRILSIIKEYDGEIEKDIISKLFIYTSAQSQPPPSLDVYLDMLIERGQVERARDCYRIIGLKELDNRLRMLKKEIDGYKERYAKFQYGYLVSIKQRNVNAIILKDCIEKIASIAEDLCRDRLVPDYERRVKRQRLLELLVNQLSRIIELVEEFHRIFLQNVNEVRGKIQALKRSLKACEESLNNLRLRSEDKRLKIKERMLIEEKEKIVEELESKIYSREELVGFSSKLQSKARSFDRLYREPRGCLIFDAKIIQMMDVYNDLNNIVENTKQALDKVQELIDDFVKLRTSFKGHELWSLKCENELSSIIYNWIRQGIGITSR